MNKFMEVTKSADVLALIRRASICVIASIFLVTTMVFIREGTVDDGLSINKVGRFASVPAVISVYNDVNERFETHEEPPAFALTAQLLMEEEEIIDVDYFDSIFTGYTDIGFNSGVTAEQLDAATTYYQKYQDFENQYLDKGWVFIEAQEKSGIDALWLYSMSAHESGWGTSYLAMNKGNYYGIGAWDSDPIGLASYMGDSFYEGIVEGAIWISEHYYQQGMVSMEAMNSTPGYSYAPGNTVWIPTISAFINNFLDRWRV